MSWLQPADGAGPPRGGIAPDPERRDDVTTTFVVFGSPGTKGSTVSFMGKHGIVTKADSATLAGWTQAVGWAARAMHLPLVEYGVPVRVSATFQFTRPRGKQTRPLPTVKPDIDKLARALLDALTGVAYVDDNQVVELQVNKSYGEDARTTVHVSQLLITAR